MSAFVHDTDHIDLLVTLAVHTEAYIWLDVNPARAVGLTTTFGQHVGTKRTPTALGQLLMRENIASVRGRYSAVDDTPEGIEYDAAAAGYIYRPVDLAALTFGGAHWSVAAVIALDSYEYQSSEHDGWVASEAKRWIDATRSRVLGQLPGREAASPHAWCFTRTH